MKKVMSASLFVIGIAMMSCGSDCKECTGCKTLPANTLCEDDFEKSSDYNDLVQNYESDGCTCSKK